MSSSQLLHAKMVQKVSIHCQLPGEQQRSMALKPRPFMSGPWLSSFILFLAFAKACKHISLGGIQNSRKREKRGFKEKEWMDKFLARSYRGGTQMHTHDPKVINFHFRKITWFFLLIFLSNIFPPFCINKQKTSLGFLTSFFLQKAIWQAQFR